MIPESNDPENDLLFLLTSYIFNNLHFHYALYIVGRKKITLDFSKFMTPISISKSSTVSEVYIVKCLLYTSLTFF